MSVEKVVENEITYRVETTETSTVKMIAEPALRYDELPPSVAAGEVLTIPLWLEDFDGERRDDTRVLTFVIEGQTFEIPMTDGEATLELELAAPGAQRIGLMTPGISMPAIRIEVTP